MNDPVFALLLMLAVFACSGGAGFLSAYLMVRAWTRGTAAANKRRRLDRLIAAQRRRRYLANLPARDQ